MRTRNRLLQTCSSRKMMAMVRTSLQKVVVFLHRLQRMAISSPRYQKLCKLEASVILQPITVRWVSSSCSGSVWPHPGGIRNTVCSSPRRTLRQSDLNRNFLMMD
ncbi:hypothetical protein FQA47_014367 [Oryzias melastigma]|uniref:Uncharacterized protein n=1 Tax=Oryzias melastigma TaxID=30732 RepID=A0A834C9P2_ORYME|nr:hypothetical protein FQA47_014367 [Oryzias melastigma]